MSFPYLPAYYKYPNSIPAFHIHFNQFYFRFCPRRPTCKKGMPTASPFPVAFLEVVVLLVVVGAVVAVVAVLLLVIVAVVEFVILVFVFAVLVVLVIIVFRHC